MEWGWLQSFVAFVFTLSLVVAIVKGIECISPALRHSHHAAHDAVVLGIIAIITFVMIGRYVDYDKKKKDWQEKKEVFCQSTNFLDDLPPKGSSCWFILQGSVNHELKVRAMALDVACRVEEAFRDTIPTAITDIFEFTAPADKLLKKVTQRKKDFWELHAAAAYFGFETKPKYGEYL